MYASVPNNVLFVQSNEDFKGIFWAFSIIAGLALSTNTYSVFSKLE